MALNVFVCVGRIVNDLELKQTQSGLSVLSFTVAVDRNFVKQGEEKQSDFIDCVAWRQHANFISNFFSKGRMIAIEGELQTRTYQDKNGNNRKAVEVLVNRASFCGEKKSETNNRTAPGEPPVQTAPIESEDLSDEGVPF